MQLVPIPLIEPEDPFTPAKVLKLEVEMMILRMSWLEVSEINAKVPSGERETPLG